MKSTLYEDNNVQETNIKEIIVSNNQQRERLDQFLADKLEKISRSQIQKLIRQEKITVNNKALKSSLLMSGEENIKILIPPPEHTELIP